MALVKFGGGITQMSGSIAGNTFARNRYGNYVRARTKPVNPNTDRQNDVRAAIAFLSDRWAQTLTAPQRTAWNLYASSVAMKNKLGETVYLSGFNQYIRSNSILKVSGRTLIDAGPVIFELPATDPTITISGSEATQDLTMTYDDTMDWDTETGGLMTIWCGRPQNPQRNFFAGPNRLWTAILGVDAAPVASPKISGIGHAWAVSEGQRIWIQARIHRVDGRVSETFRADCFIAA